jgi:hypothetical protein
MLHFVQHDDFEFFTPSPERVQCSRLRLLSLICCSLGKTGDSVAFIQAASPRRPGKVPQAGLHSLLPVAAAC